MKKTIINFVIKAIIFVVTMVYSQVAILAWMIHYDTIAYWGTREPLNAEEVTFIHAVLWALPVVITVVFGLLWLKDKLTK